MKKTVLSFVAVLVFCTAMAQSPKMSPYTNNFVSIEKAKVDIPLKKMYAIKSINNMEYVSAFIYLSEQADITNLKNLGVLVDAEYTDIVAVRVPVDKLNDVAALNDVKRIEIGFPVYKRMDKARPSAEVDKVQAGTSPLTMPFLGTGVVVGVVDHGFEYGHINFFDTAKSDLRVKRVWNQNLSGGTPSGFSGGKEYTTKEEILAAKYDDTTDAVGHGTHVTGIAAGAYKGNNYYGVASDADIVLVSYNLEDNTSDNVSISNGVKYIYNYAESVNKPCVVNMSLGMHVGPHDGTSTFDRVCDEMQGAGKLLVGSAGNEGEDKVHIKQTLTTSSPIKTFMGFYYSSTRYGMVDVWGEADSTYTVRCVIYNKSTEKEVWSTGDLRATVSKSSSFSITTGASGNVWVSREKNATNKKGNVLVTVNLNSLTSGNYVGIIVSGTGGEINMWADDNYSYLTNNSISSWTAGNATTSVGELGGTGKRIISVGAYQSRKPSIYYPVVGALTGFSSKGPTVDNRIKPDITAPGSLLISSLPSNDAAVSAMDKAAEATENGQKYYWGYMQGTSMSSPFVTGVLATWLQADKTLTPERVREVLATTSTSDSYTGSALPNNSWGYGKINAYNGLLKIITQTSVEQTKLYPEKIFLYPTVTEGHCNVLFAQSDTNLKLTVYNVNGQIVYSKAIGDITAKETFELELSDLSEGVYVVKIAGNTNSETKRILIKK